MEGFPESQPERSTTPVQEEQIAPILAGLQRKLEGVQPEGRGEYDLLPAQAQALGEVLESLKDIQSR